MADHRAEDIVTTIVTQLTGLATTGSNVFRDREYELSEAELPALLVYMVSDMPRQPSILAAPRLQDCDLRLVVEAVVKSSAAQVDTTLNQIRYEVSQALHEDVTQGLSYVMHTVEGMAFPELQADVDQMVGRLRMDWAVLYRRSRYVPPTPPPPSSCAYPLDDDGTLSAQFGYGHAAANSPDYLQVDYTYLHPATGGVAFALPSASNAFTSQAVNVGSAKVAVEMVVNSIPDVDFNGFGISTVSSTGGIPNPSETSNAHVAMYSGSPVTAFSGLSASPIGVSLVGFRVGIVMDGATGNITYVTSEGTIGTATGRFTAGTKQTFVIQITDSGFVAAGKSLSVTLVTNADDMRLTYPPGTTDPCGNALDV